MPEWKDDSDLFRLMRKELYTPVIGDILDQLKCYHQILPPQIQTLSDQHKVAGRVMPALMYDVFGPQVSPFGKLTEALDQVETNEVIVITGGSMHCAYWGEILTASVKIRGANGAIIDGYHRDTPKIVEQNFPVFSRGRFAQDSSVRSKLIDYRCPIEIGGVSIENSDVVFGDIDGVVIIPAIYIEEVIAKSLEKVRGEKLVRVEIDNGMTSTEAFSKFGIL
jgi:4-hydroxy-4-methyl-2-oxoglutarate aldolase